MVTHCEMSVPCYIDAMQWTKRQINLHLKAAQILYVIKDQAFFYIGLHSHCTEYEVQQFILGQFEEHGIYNTVDAPIVAFGPSADAPHYFPDAKTSQRLQPETIILIDIWGRLKTHGAPYADITWMGYYGQNVSKEIIKAYKTVIAARDNALALIKKKLEQNKLPTGQEIDAAACNTIIKSGYEKFILHRTGHSIGPVHVHGVHRNINHKNPHPILVNMGYTIEPGIYVKGEFGIRSEIDFYIDRTHKLIVSTPIQKGLIFI